MENVTRREILESAGLTAGLGLLAGYADLIHAASPNEDGTPATPPPKEASQSSDGPGNHWRYVQLAPSAAADAAYKGFIDGGCMYGVFAGIMSVLAKEHKDPYQSFPFHMLRYGAGGVGNWGSLCGTMNGGAAVIGLFELDKQRCENLIAELFSWYEATELPIYLPTTDKDSLAIPKSISGSILCHASVGKWCKLSGNEMGSSEMKERCRRLTADVAGKVVELLNSNLHESCKLSRGNPEVQSCMSCHGKELHDTLGKMQCSACHQQLSPKHPTVPQNTLSIAPPSAMKGP